MRRALNVAVALAAFAVTSPVWLYACLRIRLEDGGPIFFLQDRAGYRGSTFRIYKFRTMVVDAERRGLGLNVDRDDPRITRIGAWLRRWSVDELPQLINVLRGEMNIVGPRPALPQQAARYTAFQRRRLDVLPGMTGWAQVTGRNALTWARRIESDVWYVEHASVLLDLRILLLTPAAVLRSDGLYEDGAGLADEMNAFDDASGQDSSR